jgi:nucleoid-associated protein YgaU
MVVNPLKIFLFLLGVSVAGGATAFVSGVLDPYIYGKGAGAASVAELPQPPDPAAPKDERLSGTDAPTPPPGTMAALPPSEGTTPSPETMAATPPAVTGAKPPADAGAAPPSAPQPPTFDIVRVQEDGSVVVAGKAQAGSLVELLSAGTVLGSGKATPEGDFVIVLDELLRPGDHQLTLRAVPPSGAVVASLQTAVLSVPDKPGGQVLAMVEEPGEPSQILTVPEPAKPADVASAPAETAAQPRPDQPKTDQAATPPAVAGRPAGEKPADVASAPAETTPPADSTPPAEQAPKVDEAANPPADAGKPAETTPAPAAAKVAVEAVEIEGKKIFVAGVGDAGRRVRVYANEILLGESKVDPAGHFLVEAERDLPVGQYMIRADLLGADGATVQARAVVPFEREEGEAIAAVAPDQPSPPASNPLAAAKPGEAATAPAETTPPPDAGSGKPAEAAGTEQKPPADNAPAKPPAVAFDQPPAAEPPAAPADAGAPAQPKTEEAATPPPATAERPGTDVAAAQPPETTAPKLVTAQGSVIIRRGDTLWRISKRVYGRGTRYSTIYLANQPQIANPDRIWPGQIFNVPDMSKEGEPADMKALGEQMIMSPAEQSAGTAQ